MEDKITSEYVRSLTDYTDNFLCSLKDNIYKIRFIQFRVRDSETGIELFEISDEEEGEENGEEIIDEEMSNNARTIKYHLGSEFLNLKNIATSLTFSVGSLPVKNLLMIERHYFKGELIKSFEFNFDFCIPNSTNTWETIYTMPEFDDELKESLIANPWETKSDTFYFVDNKLIMHHKALYNYADE
jgi:hypothetical protein